jgi:hypothetical protein
MKNGNSLIAEGRDGTLWEVTDGEDTDWLCKTNYATIWRAYVFYCHYRIGLLIPPIYRQFFTFPQSIVQL